MTNKTIQSKKSKFIFYKTFIDYADETVPLQITAYSDKESIEKYKNKIYYLDLDKCNSVKRILEENDLDYFEEYSTFNFNIKSHQVEHIVNLLDSNSTKELEVYLKSIDINDTDYQAKKHRFYASQWVFNKLNIEPKIQKSCTFGLDDDFYKINILDDKYLIGYDGGYVMVFIKSEETENRHKEEKEIIKNDTFTSPITHEMQIPDDFFKK